jgi:hypothetical protein
MTEPRERFRPASPRERFWTVATWATWRLFKLSTTAHLRIGRLFDKVSSRKAQLWLERKRIG